MAWTLNREGPWDSMPDERKGLWRGIADDSVAAVMLPPGQERDAELERLRARLLNSGPA